MRDVDVLHERCITVLVSATAVLFSLALYIENQHVDLSWWYNTVGYATSVIWGGFLAFERWFWKLRIFSGWAVTTPNVIGTWKVSIDSQWVNETGLSPPPIVGYLAIRQTLSSIHMKMMTQQSKGDLVTGHVQQKLDSTVSIMGMYRGEPKLSMREHSTIHYGAFILELHGSPPTSFEGHYWTDRNSRGEIKSQGKRNELYDSFEAAEAGFRR